MNDTPLSWLAAEYHLPATYSCRLPFSSSNSALVSPAPGPATVRLALIRTGLEIFGRPGNHDRVSGTPPTRTGDVGNPLGERRILGTGQFLRDLFGGE